jgi:hypothetical protein
VLAERVFRAAVPRVEGLWPLLVLLLVVAGFDQSVRHHDVRGPIDFPFPTRIGPNRCSGILQSDNRGQQPRDR